MLREILNAELVIDYGLGPYFSEIYVRYGRLLRFVLSNGC